MPATDSARKGGLYPSEDEPTHRPVLDAVTAEEPEPGMSGERHPLLGMGLGDTTPCAG